MSDLKEDMAAFFKSGGKIQEIPTGVSNGEHIGNNPSRDPEDVAAERVANSARIYDNIRGEFKPKRYGEK